jgi:nucleotide-binding universal stress UspA family protein
VASSAVEHQVPGAEIGGFRLDELLQTGGMSNIWAVSRPDLDFPVIMKIPFLHRGENPIAVVSFEVEKSILPRLHGIHFPRFVAAGDFDDPYIVMERIVGASLKSRLDELPLPPHEVARIGAKIAAALHQLHEQHVIHLDLKPSNIILRPSGEAALIDFGFAHHDQLPDLLAEEFDGPIGTGPYVSPEQLYEIRSDPRSDIFALGVILYFFATGRRPFGDPSRLSGWRQRLYIDPIPPRKLAPAIPPWLQEIILRCLEEDPLRRHPTAAQLAFDLQHPKQVSLTDRATKLAGGGLWRTASRWLQSRRRKASPGAAAQVLSAPIVAAAIDLSDKSPALAGALRVATHRVLATEPDARLACLNVIKTSRMQLDEIGDAEGRTAHLQRLAELKHWAQPLNLPEDRITYHVFEATDPASVLLDYVRDNMVDHLIVGARASSLLRRYLGSVSSKIVAEAFCTVTVVRPPRG